MADGVGFLTGRAIGRIGRARQGIADGQEREGKGERIACACQFAPCGARFCTGKAEREAGPEDTGAERAATGPDFRREDIVGLHQLGRKLRAQGNLFAIEIQRQGDVFASACGARQCCEYAPAEHFRFVLGKGEPGGHVGQPGIEACHTGAEYCLELANLRACDRGKIAFARFKIQRAGFQPRQPVEFVETGKNARAVTGDGCGKRAIFVRGRAEDLLALFPVE